MVCAGKWVKDYMDRKAEKLSSLLKSGDTLPVKLRDYFETELDILRLNSWGVSKNIHHAKYIFDSELPCIYTDFHSWVRRETLLSGTVESLKNHTQIQDSIYLQFLHAYASLYTTSLSWIGSNGILPLRILEKLNWPISFGYTLSDFMRDAQVSEIDAAKILGGTLRLTLDIAVKVGKATKTDPVDLLRDVSTFKLSKFVHEWLSLDPTGRRPLLQNLRG